MVKFNNVFKDQVSNYLESSLQIRANICLKSLFGVAYLVRWLYFDSCSVRNSLVECLYCVSMYQHSGLKEADNPYLLFKSYKYSQFQ